MQIDNFKPKWQFSNKQKTKCFISKKKWTNPKAKREICKKNFNSQKTDLRELLL